MLPGALRLLLLSFIVSTSGCALLVMPTRTPSSGKVVGPDGEPVANADIEVKTWRLSMPGSFRMDVANTLRTKTDGNGRFRVSGDAELAFTILLPEGGGDFEDEYTFRAAGKPDLVGVPERYWRAAGQEADPASLRALFDSKPPLGTYLVPVLGIAFGGGQVFSGHFGGALLIGRSRTSLGARADLQVGVRGASVALGLVVLPTRVTIPLFGLEVNYRQFGFWSPDTRHRFESGPEIALDLLSLRVTLAALGTELLAPLGDRRFVVGVGFGYL